MTAEERRLCSRLAGREEPLTPGLVDAAKRHRVHLLLAAGLSVKERHTPAGVSLVRELTIAAALDAWREEAVRALLDSLASQGISVLLLKGSGLAYTLYREPQLRPRVDVDLLIRPEAVGDAEAILAASGWDRPPERDSELAEPQRHFVKRGPGNVLHHLDLHWRIANPRLFADVLTFDELESRAIDVTALGFSARTPGHVDALLVACVHRVAHHADAVDLLWLWDIHLLMEGLSADDRDRFVALAARTGMRAICSRGLQLASELFGTRGAADVAARLASDDTGSTAEPSSRFLGGVRAITVLQSDLGTLPWLGRLQLLGDHLLPSAAYMRARYPGWPRLLLPLAYVHRIVRGAPKWFRRT